MKFSSFLVACLLGVISLSEACAAAQPHFHSKPGHPNHTSSRLTVADFMGTWKVFAKSGESEFPSRNAALRNAIGKTVTFSPAKAVDRTGGDVLSLPILEGKRKPVYIVEYKRLYPDTPYPNIDPPQYQYDTPQPYAFIYFKVGYFSKIEKKIFYEDFYVGSNDKSFPFALTVDLGDTDLYLCKLNPKTGQCQDHP